MTVQLPTSQQKNISDKRLFTVEEYYKMAEHGILQADERVELINGEILNMCPINSSHSGSCDDLYEILVFELRGKATIKGQNPIRLADQTEPEPDITIAHYKEDKYRSHHPTPSEIYFVIEIADSSLERDRTVKKTIYANAGIPEYWIVNLVDFQIEIHTNPVNDDYLEKKIIRKGKKAICSVIDFQISSNRLFIFD